MAVRGRSDEWRNYSGECAPAHHLPAQIATPFSCVPDLESRRQPLALVGIIANPAASKDIRRLVAQGRVVPDWEKPLTADN